MHTAPVYSQFAADFADGPASIYFEQSQNAAKERSVTRKTQSMLQRSPLGDC
jgi:hypothetical protein